MKVKKVPLRTCVVTNEQHPKKELVRIVKNKEGVVSIDLVGKAPGRGAYHNFKKEVILKAKKSKVLDRKLEVTVPDEIYDELMVLVENEQNS